MKNQIKKPKMTLAGMVCRWIEEVETPPKSLAYLVSRYKDMEFYNHVEDEKEPTEQLMEAIFDRLTVRAYPIHQARTAVPLQAQWNAAISNWRREVRANG